MTHPVPSRRRRLCRIVAGVVLSAAILRTAPAAATAATATAAAAAASPVTDKVPDRYTPVDPAALRLDPGNVLADRMKVNLEDRLLKVDEKAITDGFVHRPGSHPWIGEHAGKFLHAAANTYRYTHDDRLKTLMDRVASTLISAQLPDGYLGTYTDDQRWTSWDVWSHKYDLIGLLAWYDVTHDDRALNCCRRIGDLLCTTFGDDAPGKRDLSDAGTHMGMAATSVLEPMCYLYRHTGDKKYLDFCLYITRTIDKHSKVIESLTDGKRVDQTANAKAYEMLSNLVGLVELYRLTGDEKFLTPATNAWTDIVANHLYLSGTTSAFEHFRPPHELPAGAPDNVGEGCVTVTWLQLNLSLLKLTADPKYADQLERTISNALLAAQNPASGDICYFTPLVGPKPYTHEINCCLSSEPRGISLIPYVVSGVIDNAIALNLYAPGTASFTLTAADGQPVTVKLTTRTDFPRTGHLAFTFDPSRQVAFDVLLRQPSWTTKSPNTYDRVKIDPAKSKDLSLDLDLTPHILQGDPSYPNFIAVQRGPQLLALDPAANPTLPIPTNATVITTNNYQLTANGYTFSGQATFPDPARHELVIKDTPVTLIPFADATKPIVFLPTKDHLPTGPLPVTFGGAESQSRPKQHLVWMPDQGAINDLRPDTYRTTHNRRKVDQDWFAIDLKHPATVKRVTFTQGPLNPDGGWFDTSTEKPRIQVKTSPDSNWQTVATLDTYPATTGTDPGQLKAGQTFETTLANPTEVTAIRILAHPATGNNPKNTYSNCAELTAYAE